MRQKLKGGKEIGVIGPYVRLAIRLAEPDDRRSLNRPTENRPYLACLMNLTSRSAIVGAHNDVAAQASVVACAGSAFIVDDRILGNCVIGVSAHLV